MKELRQAIMEVVDSRLKRAYEDDKSEISHKLYTKQRNYV